MELETETLGETGAVEEGQGAATTPDNGNEAAAATTGDEGSAGSEGSAGDEGSTGEGTAGDEDHKKPPRGVQKRLDELTKEKYEWKREADYWREMATKAPDGTPPDPAQAASTQEDTEPNADNFDDYKDYIKALNKWQVKQELKASRAEAIQEQIQLERIRQKQTTRQGFKVAAEKLQEKYPDFDDVVGESKAPCTDHMFNTMQESPDGPEIMYHLAKNPAEAARIAGLSPYGQVREIGRLEATLAGIKPPEPRRITRTTEPVRTVSGSGVTERDPNKMSMDDYAKWRMSQVQ